MIEQHVRIMRNILTKFVKENVTDPAVKTTLIVPDHVIQEVLSEYNPYMIEKLFDIEVEMSDETAETIKTIVKKCLTANYHRLMWDLFIDNGVKANVNPNTLEWEFEVIE
jgi:CRISPR/Cas system Type II protein with McrA/HNH and RuvC-like nuclease domain